MRAFCHAPLPMSRNNVLGFLGRRVATAMSEERRRGANGLDGSGFESGAVPMMSALLLLKLGDELCGELCCCSCPLDATSHALCVC